MTRSSDASLETFAAARLADLKAKGIHRTLMPTSRRFNARVQRHEQNLISFCDNDYLGLSTHPAVIAAAAEGARVYGAGAGASRLVTGDCPLNAQLEAQIARMKRMPAARIFGSGYLANIGVIPAVVGKGDIIVIDELAHACMHAGATLSGAVVRYFPHNDARAAAKLLERAPGARALLLTETVFSMDGDVAPLADLAEACATTDAWMMTDDAHGFGVVAIDNPAHIQMGTLSKAVGTYGGYVCGPTALIELLASRARSFVYTTGLPPPVLASALAALEIMETDPNLGAQALANARLFSRLLRLPEATSAILPLVLGDVARTLRASEQLAESGFLVTAIRPPTVPDGTSRLRFTFSARHQESDVTRLAECVSTILADTRVAP